MKRLLKLILYSKQKWFNIERNWCDLKEKSRNLEQMWFRAKKKYNFIVLIHIALKDDTAKDIVDQKWFCNLVYQETFEIVPVQLYHMVLQVSLSKRSSFKVFLIC